MIFEMGLKKRVIEYVAPTVREATYTWYEIAKFIDSEYESNGVCVLDDTNPRFLSLSMNLGFDIVKRRVIISKTKVEWTKNYKVREAQYAFGCYQQC